MRWRHLPLLVLIQFTCSHANDSLHAVEQLQAAHVRSRAVLSGNWASSPPGLQHLLCATPAHAGHVVKNSSIEAAPAVTFSGPAIQSLKEAGVPVYTACQVPPTPL